jgi:hypothetical protein
MAVQKQFEDYLRERRNTGWTTGNNRLSWAGIAQVRQTPS